MGQLKFMGHDLDLKKAHFNIKTKFETKGILPFFITGQEGTIYILFENVGIKPEYSNNFRWEINSEKSKITDTPYRQFFDIEDVHLLEKGDKFEVPITFTPEISGQHLLLIKLADENKKGAVGFHSGYMHFEGDYRRHFTSYSWYLIIGGIGTILIGILTVLQILQILVPVLINLI